MRNINTPVSVTLHVFAAHILLFCAFRILFTVIR